MPGSPIHPPHPVPQWTASGEGAAPWSQLLTSPLPRALTKQLRLRVLHASQCPFHISALSSQIMTSDTSPRWQDQCHHYLCTTKEAQRSQPLCLKSEPRIWTQELRGQTSAPPPLGLPPFCLLFLCTLYGHLSPKSALSLSSLRARCCPGS